MRVPIYENNNEKGSIIVEAAIYIPIAVCIIIAIIELALFNMQEYLMMYQAQRVSAVVAREIAYTGYNNLGMGENNEIDLDSFPSEAEVSSYYEAYHSDLGALYREVGGVFRALGIGGTDTSGYASRFSDAASASSLIAIGMVSPPNITVKNSLLGSSVTVEFTHEIPVPGIIKYLGYSGSTDLRAAAYTYSVNPSEFARNVNLATDMMDFIFEKVGLDKSFNSLKEKVGTILDKIL